jgi:hypothetical protein
MPTQPPLGPETTKAYFTNSGWQWPAVETCQKQGTLTDDTKPL